MFLKNRREKNFNRRPFVLASLFRAGGAGFLGDVSNFALNRQTYNAPAIPITAAGDAIGLELPVQQNEAIVNLLIETDNQSATAWTKTGLTATANVKVNAGGVPIADLLTPAATTAFHGTLQSCTVTASSPYVAYADIEFGGAAFAQVVYDNGSSVGAFINVQANGTISRGPEVAGGATAVVGGVTAMGGGIYRIFIGATHSGVGARLVVSPLPAGQGAAGANPTTTTAITDTIYVSRTGISAGSTLPDYQPNAGCLGGSNRRTGGANGLCWSDTPGGTGWVSGLPNQTVTANTTDRTAPRGGYTATKIVLGTGMVIAARANLIAGFYSGITYTASVYVYIASGQSGVTNWRITADLQDADGSNNYDSTTFDQWVRATVQVTAAGTRTFIDFNISNTSGAALTNGTIIYIADAMSNIGSSADTYTQNMEVIGGLLQYMPLFQTGTTARPLLARRPRSGIRNRALSTDDLSTVWGRTNCVVTPNADGIADLLTRSSTASAYASQAITKPAAAETWTLQWKVKKSVGNYAAMRIQGTYPARADVVFDINTGAISTAAAVFGGFASASATIVLQSDGYYLITLTATTDAVATVSVFLSFNSNNVVTDGTDSAANSAGLAKNCQPEKFGSATAYQAVTTAADITETGQPDVWHSLYDGSNDYLTAGVQSFGGASLFAAAGQAWTVWGVFRATVTANQTLIAKAGATTGNRTFHLLTDAGGLFAGYVRGTFNQIATVVTDGAFHVYAVRWDGTTCKAWLDKAAPATFTVGIATEEVQNILVGGRTESSIGTLFPGHNDVDAIARALSDTEIADLMNNLNSTYRYGL